MRDLFRKPVPTFRDHALAAHGCGLGRALVVVVAVLGYQVYQDKKKPEGVNINLGPGGISIEKK